MIANKNFWLACAAAVVIAGHAFVGEARAQAPSASAIATAKELVELKGGSNMFDPIIAGVVDQTRTALLQTSPQLSNDLTEVAQRLRTEFAPRRSELVGEAAKFYAIRFSEPELKQMVEFYKSPIGKKMVSQEPLVLDETFNYVQQWAPRVGEDVMNRFRAEMKKKGHNL
jgi:uncharacterized protein